MSDLSAFFPIPLVFLYFFTRNNLELPVRTGLGALTILFLLTGYGCLSSLGMSFLLIEVALRCALISILFV